MSLVSSLSKVVLAAGPGVVQWRARRICTRTVLPADPSGARQFIWSRAEPQHGSFSAKEKHHGLLRPLDGTRNRTDHTASDNKESPFPRLGSLVILLEQVAKNM